MKPLNYSTQTLEALNSLLSIESPTEMLKQIERLIRIVAVSGMLREYEMETEISLLFDIKEFLRSLPGDTN